MRAGIVGAGGHGLDVAEIMRAAGWEFAGWFDDDPDRDCPYPSVAIRMGTPIIIGINDPYWRWSLGQELGHLAPEPLIHPTAVLGGAGSVGAGSVGAGSVIAALCVLTTAVTIGQHTHINVAATVSQSSIVGDYCTVGPGARVCGDVRIGDRVFIGAGAVISNRAEIHDDAVVGAGAVVLPGKTVLPKTTVVGVPAREVFP